MSAVARQPTPRDLKRTEFFARWKREGFVWTAVLRDALEAVIDNEAMCMDARALVWMWLGSSGNQSLSVVNSDGIIQTQSDFARRIGAVDRDGNPDRKKVNPAFQMLKREGFYLNQGREIIPTEVFAISFNIEGGIPTNPEEEANMPLFPSFESRLHDRIAQRSPAVGTFILHQTV